MMRLSTMWKVDSTIRADGSSPVAETILERWPHDSGSVRFFRSSANFVYAFRSAEQPYFLRFADSTERNRQTIEAEVDLLAWLAGTGIDVAVPVVSGHGDAVETVKTEWGTFHAVVFPALQGEQFEIGELDTPGFARWGSALGELHAATARYPGADAAARPSWTDHLRFVKRHVPKYALAVCAEVGAVSASLAALPMDCDTCGLIHGDFELDNLVWRNGAVGILDFDDYAHHWYAADIAFALRDLFRDGVDQEDERFRAFVRGYAERRPLGEAALARIPFFARLADLVTYARIVRGLDLPADAAHPEWLKNLDRTLRIRMAAYEASVGSIA